MKHGHRTAGAVLAALLLTSSGCITVQRGAGSPSPSQADGGDVRLHITNHHGFPLEVYAVGAGTYYRMGTALPGFAGRFVLRQAMIGNGPVEFVARSGDRNPPIRSGPLLLAPGNTVDFNIAVHRLNSAAFVRR